MSWNYISTTLLNDTQKPGSLTIFFTYDLRTWLFGFRFDPDPLAVGLAMIARRIITWLTRS